MSPVGRFAQVEIDAATTFQTIDGFGVNINSQYWHQPWNRALLDRLIDDLGASLFRVDIFGKTNWPDPTGELGPDSLAPERLAAIYQGEIAQRGWGMIRRLNERGIAPYLTVSGDVPRWMLGDDGKTLTDAERFSDLLISLLDWAKNHEGLQISMFGPLNETDLGSPEGPTVAPADYARIAARFVAKLDAHGLGDLPLVLTEQAHLATNYLTEIAHDRRLAARVGVVGLHCYGDYSPETYATIRTFVGEHLGASRLWMTEFGDLDQSGEREWYVAWVMASRLFDLLEGGFAAALAWDAFDNYHDHDESWTVYGLTRTVQRAYIAKPRYYTLRQVFRAVPVGFMRIAAQTNVPGLRVLAFVNQERTELTIVGINQAQTPLHLNIHVKGVEALRTQSLTYSRTSEHERGVTVDTVALRGQHYPFTGIAALIPAESIWTLTTVGG